MPTSILFSGSCPADAGADEEEVIVVEGSGSNCQSFATSVGVAALFLSIIKL